MFKVFPFSRILLRSRCRHWLTPLSMVCFSKCCHSSISRSLTSWSADPVESVWRSRRLMEAIDQLYLGYSIIIFLAPFNCDDFDIPFNSAAALHAMQSAVIPTAIPSVRPSVCLSVRPSVTRWYPIQMNEHRITRSSLWGSKNTLVFWHQQWLGGDDPFHLKFALKVTHPPLKCAVFDQYLLITSQP